MKHWLKRVVYVATLLVVCALLGGCSPERSVTNETVSNVKGGTVVVENGIVTTDWYECSFPDVLLDTIRVDKAEASEGDLVFYVKLPDSEHRIFDLKYNSTQGDWTIECEKTTGEKVPISFVMYKTPEYMSENDKVAFLMAQEVVNDVVSTLKLKYSKKGGGEVSLERMGIIGIGMVAMMLLMVQRRKLYPDVPIWKMIALGFLLTIAGVVGTMLMYFIENGSFGGTSFFGALLFVPLLIIPAMLLRIPYKTILDLCAPSEALMLSIMKLDCLANGCCVGKYLPRFVFQFPSQIVEMIASLGVMFVLLGLEKKQRTHLYAWYLLLYGVTRGILNWFRYGTKPWLWILPNSIVWSIVSIVIGILWLSASRKRRGQKSPGC